MGNGRLTGGGWSFWAWLLVVVGCFAVAVPSGLGARSDRDSARAAAGIASLSRVAGASYGLLAAVQLERGRGAIYLNSASTTDSDLLLARRGTDLAIASWDGAVRSVTSSRRGAAVQMVRHDLAELGAQRAGVLDRSETPDEHFAWYTNLVSSLIAVAADVSGRLDLAGIGSASGYVSFLLVTEQIGQERGRIAGLLQAGRAATRASALEVTARRAVREEALRNVALVSTPADIQVLNAVNAGGPARFVRSVELSILDADAARLRSLDVATWFAQASLLLKQYQDIVVAQNAARQAGADQVAERAESRAREARITALAVLTVALMLGLGLLATTAKRIRDGASASARRSEREIASREAMLHAVLANSQSLIYVKDLDGRYLMVNRVFEQVFSVRESDVLGVDDTFIVPESASAWRANDRRAQQGEYAVEEWADTPQGRRCYESVKFPLFNADGQMYATCGISLDVTLQRAATEAMTAAVNAANAANAAKSSFLATMSHEIRTPMNAVIGMTDLLLATELDSRQLEYAETVRSSGDALLSVINNILDFSRFEAGEIDLEERPFDLRRCVEDSLALVAVTAAGLDLVADVDPACPVFVRGDVSKLRQVLINLVGNAVKFTHQGDVLVTLAVTGVGNDRTRVAFSIRDTGIGIPPERMDRLFRSFSQVDASTTRVYGGSGLGLAISQAIVRAMGGDISVVSSVGEGSTFSFTVSFARTRIEDADEPAEGASDEVTLAGRRVLVVDDNPSCRRVLAQHLGGWGLSCTTAADAEQALALLQSEAPFDLAILDFTLPGQNGLELAQAMRAVPGHQDLPLILLTSLDAPAIEASDVFSGYHTKPIRAGVLHAQVAEILHHLRPAASAGADPGERAPGPPVPQPRSGTALRILLAEDNEVNQKVAQGMLRNLGHAVDLAADGRLALAAVAATDYDVVLMDLHMPHLDGFGATRAIRAQVPSARQPYIVAMTASALPEDRRAGAEAGMDGYLLKPVRSADLAQMLAQVPWAATILGRQRAEREPEQERDQGQGDVMESDPMEGDPVPAVDRAVLAQLAEDMGGPDVLSILIEAYVDPAEPWIDELTAAAGAGDAARVAAIAHSQRSSSATLGALVLSGRLAELERRARSGDGDLVAPVAGVRAEYDRARAGLREYERHSSPAG
jgi:PAS domain S-box-containing protein